MNELLLIGQAPTHTNGPPLAGLAGQKLARLFGCSFADYLTHTQRFNLIPKWPGFDEGRDQFPLMLARQNANRMRFSFGNCRVLLIGIGVAKAFRFTVPPLRWEPMRCGTALYEMAVLPHVSGRNRWWNEPRHRRQAAQFMRGTWVEIQGKNA